MEDKAGSVLYQGRSIVIHKGAVYNDFITIDKGKEKPHNGEPLLFASVCIATR